MMSQDKELEALKRENVLQRKQLDLIAAIDAIRDAESKPQAMLDAIVDLLADRSNSSRTIWRK
ncbi:MAG: hypothetical protein JXA89_20545 [Anaerolineae bacterium]|nr:hypothetical protein [Anaerolineae bacterium]